MGQSGDNMNMPKEDWADLNQRFREPLLAYFFRRVQNRDEAEDLTQEAFIRLAQHPDRSDGKTLHAYIFTIASNLLKDRARFQMRHHVYGHRSLAEISENATTPPNLIEDRDPERVLASREALKHFWGALQELNERTREIFVLSRLEGMQQREIAKIYDISVSAVEKHILKAQAHFAARFKEP